MNSARIGGYALLLGAGAGVVASVLAPRRWGRAGGAWVAGGLSILAARDTAMIASGSLQRLRVAPGALLAVEPVCASAGIVLGARAWLGPGVPGTGPSCQAGSVQQEHLPADMMMARSATVLAVTTFAIHAVRQAIYLTPRQGRRTLRA